MTLSNKTDNEHDNAIQANPVSSNSPYMEAYIAYLDILGFSNLIANNNDEKKLIELVKTFWEGFNKSVDESRTVSDMGEDVKIDISRLSFRLYSDSIIIWSEDGTYKSFRYLLGAISCLLSYGIKNGFPLRGAINYGGFISYKPKECEKSFFGNDSIYGQPIVEAVRIEKELNWSGCIIMPNAWQHVAATWNKINTHTDDINDFIKRYPHLVWYPVPFKKSYIYAIAVNWNCEEDLGKRDEGNIINSGLVEISFLTCKEYSEHSLNASVKNKMEETIRFLDYTKSLSPLWARGYGVIPVPDSSYTTTNNKVFLQQIDKPV